MRTPSGFTLRVPPSWYEFDVWRATRTGDLARLVDARIAKTPELTPRRGVLLKLLREVARDAERQGALLCAAMVDRIGDGDGVLVASIMVFQTDGSPEPAKNTVEAIAAQVHAMTPVEGSPVWRRVEVVELAAGRAVRVAGVEVVEPDGRLPIECVVMQTLIPVPGGQGVLNVVLTSPQVQVAEELLELFEAISQTLAWSSGALGVNEVVSC